MSKPTLNGEEVQCPYCQSTIFKWYVEHNGKCPACQKPLKLDDDGNVKSLEEILADN